jgi:hypothetical protein
MGNRENVVSLTRGALLLSATPCSPLLRFVFAIPLALLSEKRV